MRLRDLVEYGSQGPYKASGSPVSAKTPGGATIVPPPPAVPSGKVKPVKDTKTLMTMLKKQQAQAKAQATSLPNQGTTGKTIKVPGIYGKDGKLLGYATLDKTGRTPVVIDPKTKKPTTKLPGLFALPPGTMKESLDTFVERPLCEQLRILDGITIDQLNKVLKS